MRRSRVLLGESTRHPRRRGMALRVSKPRLAPKKGDAISPLQCRERCFTWGGGYSDHSRSFILYRTDRWDRGDTTIAQRSGRGRWGERLGKTRLRFANLPVGGTIAIALSMVLPSRVAVPVRALGVGALVGAVGWGIARPLPPLPVA